MRVLVIDGSEGVRRRVVAQLRDAGFDVVGEGATAAEAVGLAVALAPEVIVLDVRLPDRTALDLLPRLKMTSSPPPTVVVLSNEVAYRAYALALGADHFLDKSADFERLGTTLDRLPRDRH